MVSHEGSVAIVLHLKILTTEMARRGEAPEYRHTSTLNRFEIRTRPVDCWMKE